jgi:hypothetical protein
MIRRALAEKDGATSLVNVTGPATCAATPATNTGHARLGGRQSRAHRDDYSVGPKFLDL